MRTVLLNLDEDRVRPRPQAMGCPEGMFEQQTVPAITDLQGHDEQR